MTESSETFTVSNKTKDILKSWLGKKFESQVIQRAENYLLEQDEIDYDDEANNFSAVVCGTYDYDVEITVAEKEVFASFCNCPYSGAGNCKHLAALAKSLVIINKKQNEAPINERLEEIVSNTKNKKVKVNERIGTGKVESVSKFRTFELDENLQNVIDKYCTNKHVKDIAPLKFALFPISNNQFKIDLQTNFRKYEHYVNPTATVVFETKSKKLFISKCEDCNMKMRFFCIHQSVVLETILKNNLQNILTNCSHLLPEIRTKIKHKTGITYESVERVADVFFDRKLDVFTKLQSTYNKVLDLPSQLLVNKLEAKTDNFTDKLKEVKSQEFLEYLCWQNFKDYDICTILRGKKLKNGSISSKMEEEEDPVCLDKSLQKIYRKFEFKTEEHSFKRQISDFQLNEYLKFLKDNLQELSMHPQYFKEIIEGENYYSPTKIFYKTFQFTESILKIKVNVKIENNNYNIIVNYEDENNELINFEGMRLVGQFFVIIKNKAILFENVNTANYFTEFQNEMAYEFPTIEFEMFLETVKYFEEKFEVVYDDKIKIDVQEILNPVKTIYLHQHKNTVGFQPKIGNEHETVDLFNESAFINDNTIYKIDQKGKEEFLSDIKLMHPTFEKNLLEGNPLHINHNQLFDDNWFLHFFEICKINNIEIFGQENIKNFNYNKNAAKISSHIKSGIDWFDVDVNIQFGDETVQAKDWIDALKNNQKFVKLGDGTLGLIPETWIKRLQKISQAATVDKDGLKISKFNFNIVDELFDEIDNNEIINEILERRAKIAEIKELKYKNERLPTTVNAKLRKYQHQGYNWLRFLHNFEFGGILADDMGLGKTLQAICILAFATKKSKLPNLIVMPRSLLFNWANELDKFCPSINYLVYHGTKRDKNKDEIKKHQLIISTYDTIVSDIEIYKDILFSYVILDESQAIKNPTSKRYKAMRLLKAKKRLAMTGTPIENNTFDLYAQMSFVNPGCFGSTKNFKDKFSTPIDNLGDVEAAKNLQKIIYPYLLRRTKEQVATDLPEKTESIIYCEMDKKQRKIYEELKLSVKSDILNKIENDGINKSKFLILEALMRLRQTCNSPKLMDATKFKNVESAKIIELMNLLQGDLKGKNVLIFSQFVKMLALIKTELNNAKIKFAYLDGSTRKRQEAVKDFMEDETCNVFLISIKAGNTGLNLTKADYVFIMDPWWNPAVEAQAIDRTHRIGQTKKVFAYKMICKDTIEEKIIKLQNKKKKIANDIIKVDENVLKSLDKKDVLALFD